MTDDTVSSSKKQTSMTREEVLAEVKAMSKTYTDRVELMDMYFFTLSPLLSKFGIEWSDSFANWVVT
jgi:hypothetical protein